MAIEVLNNVWIPSHFEPFVGFSGITGSPTRMRVEGWVIHFPNGYAVNVVKQADFYELRFTCDGVPLDNCLGLVLRKGVVGPPTLRYRSEIDSHWILFDLLEYAHVEVETNVKRFSLSAVIAILYFIESLPRFEQD